MCMECVAHTHSRHVEKENVLHTVVSAVMHRICCTPQTSRECVALSSRHAENLVDFPQTFQGSSFQNSLRALGSEVVREMR